MHFHFRRITPMMRAMLILVFLSICVSSYLAVALSRERAERERVTLQLNKESDLLLREHEASRWGAIILEHIDRIRRSALRVPSDKEFEDRLVEGVYRIDQYSEYLRKGEYDRRVALSTGSYSGLGVRFVEDSRGARLVDVYMDSPAERAGLEIGDVLLGLIRPSGWKIFGGLTEEEITAALQGAPESKERLSVSRAGAHDFVTNVTLVGTTSRPTVEEVALLPGRIGYLRISSFVAGQTQKEFLSAVERFRKKGKDPNGLIIDLRENLGGEMTEATGIADLLLPGGVILRTWNRKDGIKDIVKSGKTILPDVPIVVLVNRNSASASEILAAALAERDQPRAVLIGEKTYGKGIIQLITTLPSGDQVKLTTWEFFSVKNGGTAIHGAGIIPMIALEPEEVTYGHDPWRTRALKFLGEQRKQ